jgi:hypothetical protein
MSAYTKAYDIRKTEERIADYERYCKELRSDIAYFESIGRSAGGARVYLADYEGRIAEEQSKKAALEAV